MTTLAKIKQAGFSITLDGDALVISPASALTQNQREFLKQHKAEIINELRKVEPKPLSPAHRKKLLDYMAAIEETDQELIDEYLNVCANEPDKLAWALSWADKVLVKQNQPEQPLVTCRSCQHFQCYNAHGGGAGACSAGVMPYGACHWSETAHDCSKYRALVLIGGENV